MKKSTFFTTILAMLLGIVMGVYATPTFAAPGDVDDNPPGQFEIGLNEDSLEDVDLLIEKGKYSGTLDSRANILGCMGADLVSPADDVCGDHPDPDNDVTSSPPLGNGPDWADLFTGEMNGPDRVYVAPKFKDVIGPPGNPDYLDFGAITAVFIGDHISAKSELDDTTMVSNGSDSNDHQIPTYAWGTDSVPSKDDITNAYCYATSEDTDGDLIDELIIDCGVERLSNDGASHVDIELNKNFVGLDEEPPCDDLDDPDDPTTCYFVGDRAEGDLMVSLNFTQGGDFGALEIRKWDDRLEILGGQTWGDPVVKLEEEGCNPEIINGLTIPAGAVCGYNNNGDINGGPWPNFIKNPVPIDTDPFTDGMLPRNAFSEFALNINEILGAPQCISYIQIKTRTSHSFTSQLKDFAIRPFPVCGSTIRTEIHDPAHENITFGAVKVDTVIHDFAEVTVTGPGITEDPEGVVDFYFYESDDCTGAYTEHFGRPLTPVDEHDLISSSTARTVDISGLAPGDYSFHANFISAPGSDFPGSALPEPECEVITLEKYPSKIETKIHEGSAHGDDLQGQSVDIGLTVHDHAYVSVDGVFTNPPIPTGTVTFQLYADKDCLEGPLGTFPDPNDPYSFGGIDWPQYAMGLDENAEAVTGLFKPPAGEFGILASYSGDTNYESSDLAVLNCEDLTVNKVDPTIVTKVIVRDRAEVTGALADAPTGTVTIKTYRSNDCSGGIKNTKTFTLPTDESCGSGCVEQPIGLEPTGLEQLLEDGADVASYLATYSGDDNYLKRDHKCEVVKFDVITPTQ